MGGIVKAEGLGDGEWANHRQAALDDATQNSTLWDEPNEVGGATRRECYTTGEPSDLRELTPLPRPATMPGVRGAGCHRGRHGESCGTLCPAILTG